MKLFVSIPIAKNKATKMKRFLILLVSLFVLSYLTACMEKEDTPPHFVHVEKVAFDVETLSLPLTKSRTLQIIFTPEDCGNKTVSWYNTSPEIASVNEQGVVHALKEGETTIGIQTDDMHLKAEVRVAVTPFIADVPITSITLSETEHEFKVTDDALTLQATLTPSEPSIPKLAWETSDENVATVSEGIITPVGHGQCEVTANAQDGSHQTATCQIKVKGIKDLNYDSGDEYYKLIYYPVNLVVTLTDGSKVVQTWLDRNLGAKKVAASKSDFEAYGSLFQWSRKADGHEQMKWTTSSKGSLIHGISENNKRVSNREDVGHNQFIPVSASPNDWCSDSESVETGLWGGKYLNYEWHAPLKDASQVNNPCPKGYRVPSVNEMLAMAGAVLNNTIKYNAKLSVSDPNSQFASSVLHLPSSGDVLYKSSTPNAENGNVRGVYWANASAAKSENNYNNAIRLLFMPGQVIVNPYQRSNGYSIRCIRDEVMTEVQ